MIIPNVVFAHPDAAISIDVVGQSRQREHVVEHEGNTTSNVKGSFLSYWD
jgi:hypothetical protein